MLVKVNYCYQCGRPVGSQAVQCLYCSSPTRRIIRPERRCPYCDEPIRHRAIKCVHCGEFLDGRPREEKAVNAKAAQPTYVIEKAIITPHGLAGPGLSALEGAVQPRALIEAAPRGASAPRALPAPAEPEDDDHPLPIVGEHFAIVPPTPLPAGQSDSVMDVEARPSDGSLPAVVPREVAPRVSAVPTGLGHTGPPAVAPMPPALAAIIQFIRRLFFRPSATPDDTLNIASQSEEDNYRTCMMCQTEILSTDSFCYHCGQQYSARPPAGGTRSARREPEKSNALLYVLTMVCLGAYAMGGPVITKFRPEAVKPALMALAAAAPLLSLLAFLRKPGFLSRLLGLVFLLASLAVIIYFLPESLHPPK